MQQGSSPKTKASHVYHQGFPPRKVTSGFNLFLCLQGSSHLWKRAEYRALPQLGGELNSNFTSWPLQRPLPATPGGSAKPGPVPGTWAQSPQRRPRPPGACSLGAKRDGPAVTGKGLRCHSKTAAPQLASEAGSLQVPRDHAEVRYRALSLLLLLHCCNCSLTKLLGFKRNFLRRQNSVCTENKSLVSQLPSPA